MTDEKLKGLELARRLYEIGGKITRGDKHRACEVFGSGPEEPLHPKTVERYTSGKIEDLKDEDFARDLLAYLERCHETRMKMVEYLKTSLV